MYELLKDKWDDLKEVRWTPYRVLEQMGSGACPSGVPGHFAPQRLSRSRRTSNLQASRRQEDMGGDSSQCPEPHQFPGGTIPRSSETG